MAGGHDDPAAGDDIKRVATALVDGACGGAEQCLRAVATLGGRSTINRFASFLVFGNTDPGGFLWDRIPYFRGGVHAVDSRLLGRLDVDRPGPLTVTEVVAPARRISLWSVPPPPSLDGEFPPRLIQAVLIVGVLVPRVGLVPLGFDAVADACVPVNQRWVCPVSPEQDGLISCAAPAHQLGRCAGVQPGQIRVSYAYPHDGLETFPLLSKVLASWPGDEDTPQRPTSLLLSHAASWRDTQARPFASEDFIGIPDGHWMPARRSYTVTRVPSGTDFVRLRAWDGARSWTVYAPTPPVHAVLEWPPAPAGAPAFAPGEVTLAAWQLESGSLTEMSSIAGGGLRDLLARTATVSKRR